LVTLAEIVTTLLSAAAGAEAKIAAAASATLIAFSRSGVPLVEYGAWPGNPCKP
jgi:hypothetical protein